MHALLIGLATAHAAPHGAVALGGGPVTTQASVQLDLAHQGNVTWGMEARVSTTGPHFATAEWFVSDLTEGEMLVQPLLGPSADVQANDWLTLGFGVGFDLLSPVRAHRAIASSDPQEMTPLGMAVIVPAALIGNAVLMSQFEVTVGWLPVPAVSIEAGVWPTTGLLVFPQALLLVNDEMDPAWVLWALRPGAQVVAHF